MYSKGSDKKTTKSDFVAFFYHNVLSLPLGLKEVNNHLKLYFPDLSLLIKNLKKLDTDIFLITQIASQLKSNSTRIFNSNKMHVISLQAYWKSFTQLFT